MTAVVDEAIARARTELCSPRQWFNSAQASDYMSIEPGTLSLLRQRKSGPPYSGKNKLIRYRKTDLDKYLASRPRAAMTNEHLDAIKQRAVEIIRTECPNHRSLSALKRMGPHSARLDIGVAVSRACDRLGNSRGLNNWHFNLVVKAIYRGIHSGAIA